MIGSYTKTKIETPLWVVIALVCAGIAGVVAVNSELFHLKLSYSLLEWCGLVLAVGFAIWLTKEPTFALGLLLIFVFLNLSQLLVRYHGLPSLLQLLFIPLVISALNIKRDSSWFDCVLQPLTLVLLVYFVITIVSTVVADDKTIADARLVEMAKSLLIYLLLVAFINTTKRFRYAIWILLSTAACLGILGLTQVLTNTFESEFGGFARIKYAQIYGTVFEPRISGPLGDPNFFAQILLMLVPLGLFLVWTEKLKSRQFAAVILTLIVLATAFFTYSRGGAVALGIIVAMAFVAHGITKRELIIGAAIVFISLFFLPAGFTDRLATLEQVLPGGEEILHPDSSFEKRRLVTQTSWAIFLKNPIIGVGVGNYQIHFPAVSDTVGSDARLYEPPGTPQYPHNLYLEIAAETGVLGLAAFALVIGVCFWLLKRARKEFLSHGDKPSAAFATALQLALVGYLISSLFLHGHFPRYLWLLFGLIASMYVLSQTNQPAFGSKKAVGP